LTYENLCDIVTSSSSTKGIYKEISSWYNLNSKGGDIMIEYEGGEEAMTKQEIIDFCLEEAREGKTYEQILMKLLRVEGMKNPEEELAKAREEGVKR